MRAALLLLVAGCVPKGQHEITVVQLQATRTALSAQVQERAAEQQKADEQIAALQAEIALRQAQLDEIAARHALDEETFAKLASEITELETELAALKRERDRLAALVPKHRLPPPDPEADEGADARVAAEVATALAEAHGHVVEDAREAAARAEVEAAFAPLVAQGRAEVEARGHGTVVRFPTSLLFQEGFETLSPRGSTVVAAAADALSQLQGRRVVVEGHTDDAPIHTADWPSNWDRGFSRAVAVLRALEAAGVPEVLSCASYADTRPLVPHDQPGAAARNDRVELYVELDPDLEHAYAPTPPDPEEAAPAPAEPPR